MSTPQEEFVARGHEVSTLNVRFLIVALLSLITLVVVTFVGMGGLMEFYAADATSEAKAHVPRFENFDSMEVSPLYVDQARELQQRMAEQREFLNSFGATDKDQPFLRIPIEDAMTILAEQDAESLNAEASNGDVAP